MSAEAQRGEAKYDTGDRCNDDADKERQPEGEPKAHGAKRYTISTQTKKGGLRKIDLTGITQHDSQPDYRDRIRSGLHQQVEIVSGHGQEERGDNCHRCDKDNEEAASVIGTALRCRFMGFAGNDSAHAFSATFSPKSPCGRKSRNKTSTIKANASL